MCSHNTGWSLDLGAFLYDEDWAENVKAANVQRNSFKSASESLKTTLKMTKKSGFLEAKDKEIKVDSRFLHSTLQKYSNLSDGKRYYGEINI